MERKARRASAEKLYTVQFNDCCNFVAGVLPQNEQVLMGVVGDDSLFVVAAFFDEAGNFLRQESRSVPSPQNQGKPYAQIYEEQVKALWRKVEAWKVEIGLKPKGIRIARFDLPEWSHWGAGIGLFALPQFLQGCADDSSSAGHAQFRQELRDGVEEFQTNGKFVLRWGTEYWMSQDGEITDT